MASRKSSPEVAEATTRPFILENIVAELATELSDLRAGRITVARAMASALLAKQIFNGVRLAIIYQKNVEDGAKLVLPPK